MRKMWVLIISCFLFFFSTHLALAQEDKFITSASIYYDISESGETTVTHYISLENAFSEYYATTYSLTLVGNTASFESAHQGNTPLPFSIEQKDEKTRMLNVNFPDAVVGKGNKREFSITYKDKSIANKTGEVWEITIPKIESTHAARSDYKVSLSIPKSFGRIAYLSPESSRQQEVGKKVIYYFSNLEGLSKGITAGFGQFQVFSYELIYHLENPLNKPGFIDVAIPPDTAFQKVILQKMEPEPSYVYVDTNGNWLAKYILEARQKVDVRLQGNAQLYSDLRPEYLLPKNQNLSIYTSPTETWQSTDPEILKKAQELKTPRAIYDFVTNHLTYNYDRVRPNVDRLGAKEAFLNPSNAICMEFTDLFVALARAAGIPAREVNGYAYTQNPELEPLSLVADVLHSWPEYWDEERKVWIPVDPTWGSTTGGVDFFSKLDLRHLTFVIHGEDPYKPYPPGSYKLGPNPQKDVFVSFGVLPPKREADLKLSTETHGGLYFAKTQVDVLVKNQGTTSSSFSQIEVYFDDEKKGEYVIDSLPPRGEYKLPIEIPFSVLGHTLPNNVEIRFGQESYKILTHRNAILIANLSVVFLILFLLSLLTFFKSRKKTIFSELWKQLK